MLRWKWGSVHLEGETRFLSSYKAYRLGFKTAPMGSLHGAREIVELGEELDPESNFVKQGKKVSIEDDINRLFASIDIRSARSMGSSQVLRDNLQKKSMKRPMRIGSSQASGIGISQPISLKQALRGLSISQASEMAARKRLSKQSVLSGELEAGTVSRLHRTVVVEANETGQPLNKGKLVEISLVPETSSTNLPAKISEPQHLSKLENQTADSSTILIDAPTQTIKLTGMLLQAEVDTLPAEVGSKTSEMESRNRKLKLSSLTSRCRKTLPVLDEIVPASVEESTVSGKQDKKKKPKSHFASSLSRSNSGSKGIQSASTGTKLFEPLKMKKKSKVVSTCATGGSYQINKETVEDMGPSTSAINCRTADLDLKKASPESSSTNVSVDICSSSVDSTASKPALITESSKKPKRVVTKADEGSSSKEKGVFSQSSKSSIGEYSRSTSFSDESNASGSNRGGSRPHMSQDLRWEAVCGVQKQHGSLGLRHFNLLRKLGGGDIGTVYLAELTGSNCPFALKVMDSEFLALRKKMTRAQTEREILQSLDHPFLPTLFSHFTTDEFLCLVMEFCPGGDLHVLRQKQPNRSFSEQAARFYVAEVLLALEYLHMLGIVYRDLKPENILIREDGHIMLTDFDLSLRCAPNPTLLKPSSPVVDRPKRVSGPCTESSCIDPFCLQPPLQVSCFSPRLLPAASKTRKLKSDLAAQVSPLPEVVVEPTSARSNSFVGTHEYLAPEIIIGEGHGSQVDWWTYGILLYELLYGRTPFKGTTNEDTLANVVSQCLRFPDSPIVSSHARDLIRQLLQKQPENRLGSMKGAAEIKQHPFFEGLNWALIRCAIPPILPRVCDFSSKCLNEFTSTGEDLVLEMF